MDALDAIRTRRSIRKYLDKPIPPDVLQQVLSAAMYAPSACNQQPWQFVVLDDRKLLREVPKINSYAAMAAEAPVAILVCGDSSLETVPGYWVIDCSAAVQNLLLAAHALGLGAVWTGVYPQQERVEGFRRLLGLPKHVTPHSLVPLGYPVILLVGDITFEPKFIEALRQALRSGSSLLLHKRHADALGDRLKQLGETGSVEVLAPWTNPATGRPAAISNDRLAQLVAEHLPVVVEGDPVQYQINRNRQGWVIELIHNGGVVKKPDQPAVVDPQAVARVRVRPRIAIREARVWGSNQQLPLSQAFSVTVPPGQSVFVELVLQNP